MPKISVVVPVYKVEPYLRRCVDSILAQTFEDFEVILVDDGSPDNCGAICDEYTAKDARIHVIHQENGGLSAARNAGIDWAFANSDSQWLSFIDSDDWVHPCYLDYLYRAAKDSGTIVSACAFVRVEEQAEYPKIPYNYNIEKWGIGVVACCKLYEKQLFSDLRYPENRINEDEFLTYLILDQAGTVAVLNFEMYYYYQNPQGIMISGFTPNKLDVVVALGEQCRFAQKRGYRELNLECQKRRLTRCVQYLSILEKTEALSNEQKKKCEHYLRKSLREVLLNAGKIIAPIRNNRWYYELAFPHTAWVYWTIIGIGQKMRKNGK